jgi:hypothetical protein
MASTPRCPTCGGNFYPDPDDRLALACMLCGRTYKIADLRSSVVEPTPIPLAPRRTRREGAA